MPYFRNEGYYRSEDLPRDNFLRVLSHGGNENLAGLANFDFNFMTSHENEQHRSPHYKVKNSLACYRTYYHIKTRLWANVLIRPHLDLVPVPGNLYFKVARGYLLERRHPFLNRILGK